MINSDTRYRRRRKCIGVASLFLFAISLILLTLFFTKVLAPYLQSTEELRAFLNSFGWKGYLILFVLQCLQVTVALIPGEVVELGAGYAYGVIKGSLICLAGIVIASAIIFLLVKRIGIPLVEAFISREKIQQLRFINNREKLKRLVFFLFLIPGTPKDVLTYFVGLTNMKLSDFLLISIIRKESYINLRSILNRVRSLTYVPVGRLILFMLKMILK